jgi:SAM-dependent methyltransferase
VDDLEALWSNFLVYIQHAPAANNPGVLFAGFRDDLVAKGMSKDRASEAIRELVTLAAGRRDWTAPMFDRIYTSNEPGFSTRPNALVLDMIEGKAPGTALDIAMGQGRNALYLASRGWTVTGFDVSNEGIVAARREAAARGLTIEALRVAHDEFEYGSAAWDLIVMTYALVPVTDVDFAARLVESLRPGGLIVIESFGTVPDRPIRPVEIDSDRLRDAYSGLRVLRFEEATDVGDWTDEPAPIVRMAAIKD